MFRESVKVKTVSADSGEIARSPSAELVAESKNSHYNKNNSGPCRDYAYGTCIKDSDQCLYESVVYCSHYCSC